MIRGRYDYGYRICSETGFNPAAHHAICGFDYQKVHLWCSMAFPKKKTTLRRLGACLRKHFGAANVRPMRVPYPVQDSYTYYVKTKKTGRWSRRAEGYPKKTGKLALENTPRTAPTPYDRMLAP